jgi:hypothetical protein
VVVGVV